MKKSLLGLTFCFVALGFGREGRAQNFFSKIGPTPIP